MAIIGAGPAGLSCATFLLREGIAVELFDKQNRAGGLLSYGIPGFKLDKSDIERRVEFLNTRLELNLTKIVKLEKILVLKS